MGIRISSGLPSRTTTTMLKLYTLIKSQGHFLYCHAHTPTAAAKASTVRPRSSKKFFNFSATLGGELFGASPAFVRAQEKKHLAKARHTPPTYQAQHTPNALSSHIKHQLNTLYHHNPDLNGYKPFLLHPLAYLQFLNAAAITSQGKFQHLLSPLDTHENIQAQFCASTIAPPAVIPAPSSSKPPVILISELAWHCGITQTESAELLATIAKTHAAQTIFIANTSFPRMAWLQHIRPAVIVTAAEAPFGTHGYRLCLVHHNTAAASPTMEELFTQTFLQPNRYTPPHTLLLQASRHPHWSAMALILYRAGITYYFHHCTRSSTKRLSHQFQQTMKTLKALSSVEQLILLPPAVMPLMAVVILKDSVSRHLLTALRAAILPTRAQATRQYWKATGITGVVQITATCWRLFTQHASFSCCELPRLNNPLTALPTQLQAKASSTDLAGATKIMLYTSIPLRTPPAHIQKPLAELENFIRHLAAFTRDEQ